MSKDGDRRVNSNTNVARTVYMYILIVGALALMSTSHFSFDVLTARDPEWSSVALFWLTLVMLSASYYMFDRSIRESRWFSVMMAVFFLISIAYPFYTLSDPRLMVVRMLTGMVVMLALHSLYTTVTKSVKKFEEYETPNRPVGSRRPERGVNNLTRMRPPITDSRHALRENSYAVTDEELLLPVHELSDDEIEFFRLLSENTEADRDMQRMIDSLMSNGAPDRISERMKRVRARREFAKKPGKEYILKMSSLEEDDVLDISEDTGSNESETGDDKEE